MRVAPGLATRRHSSSLALALGLAVRLALRRRGRSARRRPGALVLVGLLRGGRCGGGAGTLRVAVLRVRLPGCERDANRLALVADGDLLTVRVARRVLRLA